MFAAKAFAIASFVLAGVRALEVSTPTNVVQCGDTHITVSGATGQYYISVVPVENSCESDALFESEALTDGSYTWKTKLPSGTQALIVVDDETGTEAWSSAFTVGDGDAACLSASSSSGSTSASSTSSSASAIRTSSASATRTDLVINNRPTSTSSASVDTPANAQDNGASTSAAFSVAQASLFTVLAAMGVVAMAL